MQHTNKAQQGQSFIDMVYQATGSFEGVIEAAILNGKSITDDVAIGEIILIDKVIHQEMRNILQRRNPATALREELNIEQPEGISYWTIGLNFKVN